MAVGAAWLKAWICENRKNRRHFRASPNESPTFICFFQKSLRCRKNVHFFPKGPLRGTMSSVITSRARGLSVLRRKNGFFWDLFGEQHSIGRLIAPQCESHSPHDAAFGYHWSKFRTRGRKHTQDTAQMKAGMQKSRKLPDFVVRPAEAHASIFSRKLLLAPSNAQFFLAARPPLGARGPTAQIWDPLSERTPPSAWRGRRGPVCPNSLADYLLLPQVLSRGSSCSRSAPKVCLSHPWPALERMISPPSPPAPIPPIF